MTVLENILLAFHLLGFGALFGGIVIQAKDPVKKVNFLMRDGAGATVVAGLVLYIIEKVRDTHSTAWDARMGVMMLVGIVVLGLVMANLRKASISRNLWLVILLLVVANVGVGVVWTAG